MAVTFLRGVRRADTHRDRIHRVRRNPSDPVGQAIHCPRCNEYGPYGRGHPDCKEMAATQILDEIQCAT